MPGARDGVKLGTLVAAAGLAAVLVALPLAGDYTLYVLALVVVQSIAILSLNLLMGYAGQVSLGQAALVGIGAFSTAEFARAGVPFPLTLVAGTMFAAVAAAVVGLPSLRIKGLQVAAVTLAFGVMAWRLLFARPWDAGSGTALPIPRPGVVAGGAAFLILAVASLGAVLLLDRAIRRSRIGRAFVAVRDREDTAAARGIKVGPTKLLAYTLSGAYAGLSGALFAYLVERVSADSFDVFRSLLLVAAVVVGGLGSWTGALVAGVAFAGLPELLRPASEYAPLGGAVLLVLVPLLHPGGLGRLLEWRVPLPRRWRRGAAPAGGPGVLAAETRPLPLAMPVRTLLWARDVVVQFGGLSALGGVDVEVRRGEIVGLIGPNGAGKTTFFNALSGFVRPARGEVRYRGRDLLALPPDARPSLGIERTFQNVGLCGPETVWDNLLIAQHRLAAYGTGAALLRAPNVVAAERRLARRARAALDVTTMGGLAGERVASLPHGRQRLAEVAAALAAGPELLMLDEPFAGMGPKESEELAHRLAALRDELDLTILVIAHDVPLVAGLCDYVYVLAGGVVLAEGVPDEVVSDPEVIATYIGEPAESGSAPERLPEPIVLGAARG